MKYGENNDGNNDVRKTVKILKKLKPVIHVYAGHYPGIGSQSRCGKGVLLSECVAFMEDATCPECKNEFN